MNIKIQVAAVFDKTGENRITVAFKFNPLDIIGANSEFRIRVIAEDLKKEAMAQGVDEKRANSLITYYAISTVCQMADRGAKIHLDSEEFVDELWATLLIGDVN